MKNLLASFLLFLFALTSVTCAGNDTFFGDIFSALAKDETEKNLLFSPVSIKTCLGMAYLGAVGNTKNAIKNGIDLSNASKEQIAKELGQLTKKPQNDDFTLSIVNRVYVDDKFKPKTKFNKLSSKHFGATAGKVNFDKKQKAVQQINTWVAKQTKQKISSSIIANSLKPPIPGVLVNAIYVKAKWQIPFSTSITEVRDFIVDNTTIVPSTMMHQVNYILYGELTELDAKAIELEFVGSDLTMLVILPNSLDGLAALEEELKTIDVTSITARLQISRVHFCLPRFKIEYDISLVSALKELSMGIMFKPTANFSDLLKNANKFHISEVKHKALMELTESGAEPIDPAYVANVTPAPVSDETTYRFVTNHPFFFAIKDEHNIYLAGHIVNF